ncbi:peptide N-acetyl-beta-D-glucosaminyl asparaginase amidase A-domain-containing protein [Cercophora scortea]|uniref:Peptide N-acetyl-beta-D-glucosaminyl asparaginase amidase A-domain-containing protein n=1 Tax=Cercophora scortea TaxID=314031 RepID=A0AAE0IN86_9PEZI|nr:peptide N-acetyl-beta-D-glucosaminyl asparaginase amidase A-domain-containing protein [Cercophora scortea]
MRRHLIAGLLNWALSFGTVRCVPSGSGIRLGQSHDAVRRSSQTDPVSNITRDFEVASPVQIPSHGVCATQQLMVHSFGSSYGTPFVGAYTPPSCDFNSVVISFTATSSGVQYDRLAMMYLSDTEVWRTSTAEPTRAGIIWTYTKDMSAYLSLWEKPQTIIFELDNIVNNVYTGPFNTTLTATFFTADKPPPKADLILPISSRQGSVGKQSVFNIPADNATVVYTIPDHVTRATVSISANGQINEEFWYTNVFTSQVDTFKDAVGTLVGGGPFREIQLLIDGHLAGVVWPFPVIFTGGVAPGFWRPIVNIQAFDLAESEIDITPFLPLLLDGKPHSFTISVLQLADSKGNGTPTLTEVESFWLATGKIFLFYGTEKTPRPASHALPKITGVDPTISISSSITSFPNGTNSSLTYTTTANRALTISSPYGSWKQTLSYTNTGELTSRGFVQTNTQSTHGTQSAVNTHAPAFNQDLTFDYPITVTTTYEINPKGGIRIDASLSTGLSFRDSGRPDISPYSLVSGPASLNTLQQGTGHYSSVANASYSFGTTEQTFAKTSYGSMYRRDVNAANGTVVQDSLGVPTVGGRPPVLDPVRGAFDGPRGFIGRGPGSPWKGL